ncbi:MAG TPA: TonB family protein [Pyrinomonadaceae bacterium]|jgi:TonB family protein
MKIFGTILLFFVSFQIFSITGFGRFEKPKAVKYFAPKYPAAARAVRAAGTVIVNVKINGDGKVISAVSESGHPLLRKACENAAQEWIFSTDSKTNEREAKITFLLRLGNRNRKDKVKFKKPYTLELVGVMDKIVNTIDY